MATAKRHSPAQVHRVHRAKSPEAHAKERARRRQEVEEVVVRKHGPLRDFNHFSRLFKAKLVPKAAIATQALGECQAGVRVVEPLRAHGVLDARALPLHREAVEEGELQQHLARHNTPHFLAALVSKVCTSLK